MSKFFNKIKSILNLQSDEKLLIGKLSHSASKPSLGYIDVYFEVVEGLVIQPIPEDFTDIESPKKIQVFVRGGYESFEDDYGVDKLFIFKSHLNVQSSDRGLKYTCVYSDSGDRCNLKLTKDSPFIAEISQTNFSQETIINIQTAHKIEHYDKDFFDTPCFFQMDETSKKLLGPLIASDSQKSIFHGPSNKTTYDFWNSRSLFDYQTFLSNYDSYDEHIVNININGISRNFLINLEDFYIGDNNKPRNQDFTLIDLIPENCLINEFYNATNKISNIKPFQKGKVKEWLDNKGIKLDKSRKSRLFNLLKDFENNQENIDEIYKHILDSEQAEKKLQHFANEDEAKYLNRYRNKQNVQIEEIKNDVQQQKIQIEQQNEAVKNELSKKQKELVALNKEKNDLQHEIEEELKIALKNVEQTEEYQSRVNESNQELADINKKVEDATKIYCHYENLEELKGIKDKLESDIESHTAINNHLTNMSNKLRLQAKKDSSDLAAQYIDNQIISDVQNYDHHKYMQDKPTQSTNEVKSFISIADSQAEFSTDDCNSNRASVVKCITQRLRDMNRSIQQDKVEAALVAIMQNQFVVLTGVPGSGKTSFAMQLGCALGASKSTLSIPVAKDWTRPKDLMGYYNPVTNVYESGVTNFHPFYQSLNKTCENTTTNSFLILDEFNLSQPEFYLSNLTGLADNSGSRVVNLGHGINISIPFSNRFICTANTDETVQSLSARMISRCAFIQFNELPELDQAIVDLTFPEDLQPLLTGTDMISLFTASDSDILSGSLKSDIDKLISSFREPSDNYGNGISITPRKYNQFLQFCKVMSVQEHGQSKVLDYASTFFLLPLITGMGALFKNRLKNIKLIGEDLSLDEFVKHLDSILLKGETSFDHYHFIMG